MRSNRVLRPAVRVVRKALQRGLRVNLLTPEHGLEVDRVLSRAFTPTISSYAVYTRDCDDDDLVRIREALLELELDDGRPALDGWGHWRLYGGPCASWRRSSTRRIGVRRPSKFEARMSSMPDGVRGAHQRTDRDVGRPQVPRWSSIGIFMDLCPTCSDDGAPTPTEPTSHALEAFRSDSIGQNGPRGRYEVDPATRNRSSPSSAKTRDLGYSSRSPPRVDLAPERVP